MRNWNMNSFFTVRTEKWMIIMVAKVRKLSPQITYKYSIYWWEEPIRKIVLKEDDSAIFSITSYFYFTIDFYGLQLMF